MATEARSLWFCASSASCALSSRDFVLIRDIPSSKNATQGINARIYVNYFYQSIASLRVVEPRVIDFSAETRGVATILMFEQNFVCSNSYVDPTEHIFNLPAKEIQKSSLSSQSLAHASSL